MISIHLLYFFTLLSGCSFSDTKDVGLKTSQEEKTDVPDSDKEFEIEKKQEIEKLESDDSISKLTEGMVTKDKEPKEEVESKKIIDKETGKKTKKESSIEMGDMELFKNLDLHFSGVSPIFQNYFYNENAQESYLKFVHRDAKLNVRNLPVYIRWDDVGHSMGRGEICVYSSELLPQEHIPSYSKALYAYRTYLGSYFDVRLMSFAMCIESSNCRFEVLDRSDLSGVTSCVTFFSDKESGALRPVNTKAKGEKVCTSSFSKEERSKIPISYDSLEEQFAELWPRVGGCFLD